MLSRGRILTLVLIAGCFALASTGCMTVRIPRIWDGEEPRRACGNPVLVDCEGILVAASPRSLVCGVLFNLPEFREPRRSTRSRNLPRIAYLSRGEPEWAKREEAFERIASLRRRSRPVRTPLSQVSLLPGGSLLLLMAPRF